GEGDDWYGIRRDRVRHEGLPDSPPARQRERDEDREPATDREAAEGLLEGQPACSQKLASLVPECRRDRPRLRQQELLDVEEVDRLLPDRERRDENDDGWSPVRETAAHDPAEPASRQRLDCGRSPARHSRASAGLGTSSCLSMSAPRCSSSRTFVTSSKNRGSSRVAAIRGC